MFRAKELDCWRWGSRTAYTAHDGLDLGEGITSGRYNTFGRLSCVCCAVENCQRITRTLRRNHFKCNHKFACRCWRQSLGERRMRRRKFAYENKVAKQLICQIEYIHMRLSHLHMLFSAGVGQRGMTDDTSSDFQLNQAFQRTFCIYLSHFIVGYQFRRIFIFPQKANLTTFFYIRKMQWSWTPCSCSNELW